MKWVQAHVQCLPSPLGSLLPKQRGDVLEGDELWAFAERKCNAVWLWTALYRRTRQIAAFVLGDRSGASCRRLWGPFQVPTVAVVLTAISGKETGQMAHQERWSCTLRQRISRFMRKILSFSKSETNHELVPRWFVIQYNLEARPSLTR
jgi:insertion element IS1 protein InsB